ncbi:MAG: 4Fe-4S dicluster domain-containing protein [Candidatus Altiarchaeota archaeon]
MVKIDKSNAEKPQQKTKPKGEVHIIRNRCKGCGFCIEFCPMKVLEVSKDFNEKGYHPPEATHPEKCIACKMCELLCPEFSIYIKTHEDEKILKNG